MQDESWLRDRDELREVVVVVVGGGAEKRTVAGKKTILNKMGKNFT